MPLQRLDIKSARFDALSGSVLIDGRNAVIEVSLEALEMLAKSALTPERAVQRAIIEVKRLTQLASRLPADDGKIIITANLLANDGRFATEHGS